MPKILPKKKEPQPAANKLKPMRGMKTLPGIGDPKSPAATVSGQRSKKMPPFPVWGAPVTGQRVHKLPSLCDPKS